MNIAFLFSNIFTHIIRVKTNYNVKGEAEVMMSAYLIYNSFCIVLY